MIGYFKTVKSTKSNQSSSKNRILHDHKVIDFGLDKVSYRQEDAESVVETLAEKIANGEYVEPYNWQNKTQYCSNKNENGYLKIGSDGTTDPTLSKYFWVEELKNWCTYRVWSSCPLTIDGIEWSVTVNAKLGNYYGHMGGYVQTYTFKQTFTQSDGEFGSVAIYEGEPYKEDAKKFAEAYKQEVFNYIKNHSTEFKDSNAAAAFYITRTKVEACNFIVSVKNSAVDYQSSIKWEDNHFVGHNELSYLKDVGITVLQLCVWNGVDAFVPLNTFTMFDGYKEVAWMQNFIINKAKLTNGYVKKERGWYGYNSAQELTGYGDPQWYFSYDPNVTVVSKSQGNITLKGESWYQSPTSILHAIILESNKNYSIYDKSTFQCRRLGKPAYAYYFNNWKGVNRSSFDVAKDRSSVRQGMSTGNPGIFRTATGELALATMLVYGGVMQLFGDHGNGFDTAPVNFLNDICKEFFGDGLNKTCAKDWLKPGDRINTNDELPTGDIQTLYETSLDKTLIPQMNKATKDKLSMAITTEDVAVEIEEEKKPDYAVKW